MRTAFVLLFAATLVTPAIRPLAAQGSPVAHADPLARTGDTAGALGLTAKGDNPVSLAFTRERSARPVLLDYLAVELGDAPAGSYGLAVHVTDLAAGSSAGGDRAIVIIP